MNIGNQNYTNFVAVNFKNGVCRFAMSGYGGTLTVSTLVGDRAWTLIDKSGKLGTSGTFALSLAAFGKGTCTSTAVTVTGITAEDGVVVTPMFAMTGTSRVLVSAVPGAGVITCYFSNYTATDQGTSDLLPFAYTAVK